LQISFRSIKPEERPTGWISDGTRPRSSSEDHNSRMIASTTENAIAWQFATNSLSASSSRHVSWALSADKS
jgi:hypothetical protein